MNKVKQKPQKSIGSHPHTTFLRRYKEVEYELFAQWCSLPLNERKKSGVPTQIDFGKKYGVNPQTLTQWKLRDDFRPMVEQHVKKWGKDLLPNIMLALYRKAIKEDSHPKYTELWLQYVDNWNPRIKAENNEDELVNMALATLQKLIGVLPIEDQQYFYKTIRDLVNKANKYIEEV